MASQQFIYFFADGCSEVEGAKAFAPGDEEGASAVRDLIGGKGASLHAMTAMGFRVPPGFTIVTSCCAAYYAGGETWPVGLREQLAAALARLEEVTGMRLGDPDDPLLVSVRSGAAVSMPGMLDTILNVSSRAGVEEAVERVFRSWQSDRAVTYRQQKAILRQGGTAVTVQQMCPAEVAGVVFTADPANGEPVVIIEAVQGLGDGLVSGAVTPDRYRLVLPDLEVVAERVAGGARLLSLEQLCEIASVSRDLETRFRCPLDIEWALARGELFLLQARPLLHTSATPSARDLLAREAEKLRRFSGQQQSLSPRASRRDAPAQRSGGGGVFVRHNLDETLSYPTPMTWDILGEFFKGSGGFGSLYHKLGYRPSPRVMKEGFLVTVCGRIYADLNRAAELFFPTALIRYDAQAIRRQPDLLNEPPQQWETKGASPIALLQTLYHCWRSGIGVERARRNFFDHFCRDLLPPYLQWCHQKGQLDLSLLDSSRLLEELGERVEKVFGGFVPNALELSLLAGIAYTELREFLERRLGEVPGREATRTLVSFLAIDLNVDQNRALAALGRGELAMPEFLDRFGHRAAGEMELARPRWREDKEAVQRMVDAAGKAPQDIEARIDNRKKAAQREEHRLRELLASERGDEIVLEWERRLAEARTLLPWREIGKHYWMLGSHLVRRVLVELDRRLQLDGSIFYFTRAELSEVVVDGGRLTGKHRKLLSARREEERLAHSISLPNIITADDLESLAQEGPVRKTERVTHSVLQGIPIAGGSGEGHAWLCESPQEPCPVTPPYVLVTSSTDPGWTPLLAGAAALVVERGGALSHGAIVCREFGVPAVVVPDVTRSLTTGEFLRVDGAGGTVTRRKEPGEAREHSDFAAIGSDVDSPHAIAGCHIPAEPYVKPVKPHLARRAAIGLATATIVSLLVVAVAQIRSAILPSIQLAYDWTLLAGFSPFWSILFASATAAAMAILIQMAILDRRQLSQMRERLKWYRQQLKKLSREGSQQLLPATLVAVSTLQRRRGQALAQRSLELLRPIGWSFLPFCLAFIWVQERFPAEPIRPGSSFTITACFRPRAGNTYLRYATVDVPLPLNASDNTGIRRDSSADRDHQQEAPSGRLKLLDEAYQKLRPNGDAPALGPHQVTWSFEAASEGLATIAVTARDERWERAVLITEERRFAPATPVRHLRPDMNEAGEITEVRVNYPPARVRLPDGAFRLVDTAAQWLAGGRSIRPEQASWDPRTLFLSTAVVFALAFQRIAGLR